MAEDRNQKARREFILKSSVARGTLQALDRFANPLQPGDHFIWHPPYDLIWQVVDVKPSLNPKAPAGMLQLTLTATVPDWPVQGLVPQVSMIRVGGPPAADETTETTSDQERHDVQVEQGTTTAETPQHGDAADAAPGDRIKLVE